jgi:hypothetical protein
LPRPALERAGKVAETVDRDTDPEGARAKIREAISEYVGERSA